VTTKMVVRKFMENVCRSGGGAYLGLCWHCSVFVAALHGMMEYRRGLAMRILSVCLSVG